jgi:hypothetical protein
MLAARGQKSEVSVPRSTLTLVAVALIIGAVVILALMPGCATSGADSQDAYADMVGSLWQTVVTNYTAYVTSGQTNLVPAVTPISPDAPIGFMPATTSTVTATAAPVAKWPAHHCAKFFVHGQAGEDDVRLNAFSAARAAGRDCIECVADFGMSDELGMHLLKLQHPDIPGYYLRELLLKQRTDGWFFKAQRAGITRWVHDLGTPSMAQAQRWWYLVKDYSAAELQLCISGATAPEVQTYLLNNSNHVGIVISAERSRGWRSAIEGQRAAMKSWLRAQPLCAWCGTKANLNVHHKLPAAQCLARGDYAGLSAATNFITLCRPHHFSIGHLGHWTNWNSHVEADCAKQGERR